MKRKHITTIILLIFAIALFALRWPANVYVSDVKTWGEYRPPLGAGTTFFSSVFRGGGGTPAVLAMLGGQRYMVANIMWQYSEVLFHEGKLYEMVAPLDATVTLNPSFAEAWSIYGWHLAWNIYSYTDNPVEKKKWMEAGTNVYIESIKANPDKPNYRFDLAWLYKEREGNYRKALLLLEPVVFPKDGEKVFEPRTIDDINHLKKQEEDFMREMEEEEGGDHEGHDHGSSDDSWILDERRWDHKKTGHLLAIVYRKLAVQTGDWSYLEKAIKTYRLIEKIDPYTDRAKLLADNLETKIGDMEWLKQNQQDDANVRRNFKLPTIEYNNPIEVIYPDNTTGI